jgi:hypothetical protein
VELRNEKSVDVSRGVPVRGSTQGGTADSERRVTHSDRQVVGGQPQTPPTELRHHHLPKLESHGVIEWNRQTDTVTRGRAFEEIEPLLRLILNNPHKLPTGLFS